jgi:antitoxin component YwqK of YwqJK toxin-antitoxin module
MSLICILFRTSGNINLIMIIMKKLKPVLLILLFTAFCLAGTGQKKPESKPVVKSVIVLEEKYDQLVRKQYKESETYYDEHGNILEEITYKQGKINKHFKYQYDTDGNKIREEEYDPSGKLLEYSEYKIENGLRVEKIVYEPNKKPKSRKVYQYTTF